MRIGGSGFSFFGGSTGSRSDSFKRGRRPGQKVRGKLLKWVSDNTAWVEIEGHKLLAQLQSRPPVGAILTFIIKQLQPDIILKEVFEIPIGGANALNLASDFEAARTLFETRFRPLSADLAGVRPSNRLSSFIKSIALDKKLLSTYLDTTACLERINSAINAKQVGILRYLPWLLPSARRHINLTASLKKESGTIFESTMEFELNNFGMVRLEFLHKSPVTGYRIKAQQSTHSKALHKYLLSRDHGPLSNDMNFLGISQLPANKHGGILSETIFQ